MAAAIKTKDEAVRRIAECSSSLHGYGISELAIFGSFSRNQAGSNSDVDIFVKFETGKKTFDNFMDAALLLEDVLGRKVELVTEESLSPYLKPYIMKDIEYVPLPN